MKPFDSQTLQHKTTWTDDELREEMRLLSTAELALRELGDRYDIVVADIVMQHYSRQSMARARRLDGY